MLLYHYVALSVSRLLLMPSWGGAWVYNAITMCMGLDMAEALQKPTYTGT